MAAKIHLFRKFGKKKEKSYLIDFDLLITNICTISTFEAQLPVKKRFKYENSKWPPKPEVAQNSISLL